MGLFNGFSMNGKQIFNDPGKYARDFEIVEVREPGKKPRREARYLGEWTVMRFFSAGTRLRLYGALLLSLLLAACWVRMVLLTHLTSGSLWVMIPLLAGLLPVLYLLLGAFSLPFRGKPLRRDQYDHSFLRVYRSASVAGILSLLGQVITLILRARSGDWTWLSGDIHFTICGLLIPAAAAGIIALLYSIEITSVSNEHVSTKP